MLQGCFSALSLRNSICSLLIKCVSALHSTWQVFERALKGDHLLRLRRWLVDVLLNGSLWKVCPCPCSVWAHSKNTNTPIFFVQAPCSQKILFFAMVICCSTSRTRAYSEVAMTVVPYSLFFFFSLIREAELHANKEKIGCRCQEPIHSTSPSVRHGYLFICSLFVGFCVRFMRQLISPVSLQQELIRFVTACMFCIPSLSTLCDWADKHRADRTRNPARPCIPKIQKM